MMRGVSPSIGAVGIMVAVG